VKKRTQTALVRLAVVLAARRRSTRRAERARLRMGERERIVPEGSKEPRAELAVIALLVFSALCAGAFIAVYALDRLPAHTQLLGLSLGLSLVSLAAALVVIGKKLVVTEELEDSYPEEEHPAEQELVVQAVADSGSRFSRGGLVKASGALVGATLGFAFLAPLMSLGPFLDMDSYYATPWKRGRHLVDENGRRYRASDIEEGTFYTAFAEDWDREDMSASVVVIRLSKGQLDLPKELRHYPAEGIVAYSKICTHAGCAISLYRAPLFRPDEPKPALVCPCHYSTFDPGEGGKVIFGPAGRKLPMLPLYVDRKGLLRSAGTFDGPVGPSWWGVRLRGAKSA
jgi:ubiquinol-cytochrome c reductase iron-sulfur subunit